MIKNSLIFVVHLTSSHVYFFFIILIDLLLLDVFHNTISIGREDIHIFPGFKAKIFTEDALVIYSVYFFFTLFIHWS